MRQDLEYAIRSLTKNLGVVSIIVVTLALAIGANTAIFSVVNTVILKPLPFHDVNRLVHIWEAYPKGSRYEWGSDKGNIIVRPGTYFDWKEQSRSYDRMASYSWRAVLLGGGEKAENAHAHEVDREFFPTLAVKPELGRTFQPDDFERGDQRIAVLSHSLWQTRYGGDTGIVGKTVTLDNASYRVLGVMPAGFYPTRWETPKLWLPLHLTPEQKQSRVGWKLFTFARLKDGVTFEGAQREMDVISDRLTAAHPDHYDNMCAVLTPVTGYLFSQYEKLFSMLLGAVGLVLLIACANVTNLQLARASGRDREFALRAALGASRWRLIRQLLTESVLLSGIGAVLGIGLAALATRPILALLPASSRVPRIEDVGLDWRVLLFTAGVAVIAGILFGLAPALRASRTDLNETLKEGGRSGSQGNAARRIGNGLIVGEMALSIMLLVAAGVLIQSFLRLLGSDPGLKPERVLALSFGVPAHKYGAYESGGRNLSRVRLFENLEGRVRELPGVRSAVVATQLPLRHGPNPWSMHIVGKSAPPSNPKGYGGAARNKQTGLPSHGDISLQRITPGYFETFGIPVLRGRAFNVRDTAAAPMVGLVNEANAKKHFGTDDPIGRTIVLDMTSYFPRMTVVGIVADSRMNGVDKEVYPQVFVPMAQWPGSSGWLAVRTDAEPASFARSVQQAMREVDPDVSVAEVSTMEDVLGDSLWRQRLTAVLLGSFAGLAALLAGAGIYGVFSYFVNQRVKEMGVRVALGASGRQIFGLIVGSALRLALAGIALGVAGALAGGRLLSTWLHNVSSNDAPTIVATSALLLAIALVASAIPAFRATRVDPVVALREQ